MRILFVTPAFPPFPGGGERYARSLALHLAQGGHEITVLTSTAQTEQELWRSSPHHTVREELDETIRLIRCPLQGIPGGWPALQAWRKAMILLSALPGDQSTLLMRMARRIPSIPTLATTLDQLPGKFDLVHGFNLSWEFPLVAGWRFARRQNYPFVVTPFAHFGSGLQDRVARNSTMDHQRRILADADAVLSLTSIEQEGLIHLGVRPEQISVAGTGLDPLLPTAAAGDVMARYDLTLPMILFIGRVSYEKGAIHAAQATVALRQKGMPVTLVLAGQVAPEFSRYYAGLEPTAQQWIRPLGIVSEAEKHALLDACEMLLLPSRTDSFGIVLLEAWGHGKPVVGAHAGGIPAVVTHGQDGLLAAFGDVEALAANIEQLLTDNPLRRKMGERGKAKINTTYSWDRVTERVITAYRRLL